MSSHQAPNHTFGGHQKIISNWQKEVTWKNNTKKKCPIFESDNILNPCQLYSWIQGKGGLILETVGRGS